AERPATVSGPRQSEGGRKGFMPAPSRLARTASERRPGARVSSHGGREIEPRLRAPFEAKFAHDFSAVRVHDDAQAAGAARANRAQAVTVGSDVFFAPGPYAPTSRPGAELLGHELAHVAQQQRGGASPDAEARADKAAEAVMRNEALSPDALGGAPVSAQTKPEPDMPAPDRKEPPGTVTPDQALSPDIARGAPVLEPSKPQPDTPAPERHEPQAAPGEHFGSTLDRFGFDSDGLTGDHLKAIDSLAFS